MNKLAGAMYTAATVAGEILTPDPSYGQQLQPFRTGTIPERYSTEMGSHFHTNFDGEFFDSYDMIHYLKVFPSVRGTDFWAYAGETFSNKTLPPPSCGVGFPVELRYRNGNGMYLLPTAEGDFRGIKEATLYGTLKLDKYFVDFDPSFSIRDGGSFTGTSLNVGKRVGKIDVAVSSSYSSQSGQFGPVYGRVMFPLLHGFDVDMGAGYDRPSGVNFRLNVSGVFGKIHRGRGPPAGPGKGPTLRVAGHTIYSPHSRPGNYRGSMKGHCPYDSKAYKARKKFYSMR